MMDKTREAFEADCNERGIDCRRNNTELGVMLLGDYFVDRTERLWIGWQAAWTASRSAAMEECAQEAESFRSTDSAVNLTSREIIAGEAAENIASAIRAKAGG